MSDDLSRNGCLGIFQGFLALAGLFPVTMYCTKLGHEKGHKDALEWIAQEKEKKFTDFAQQANPYFVKNAGMSFTEWLELQKEHEKLEVMKKEVSEMENRLSNLQQKTR